MSKSKLINLRVTEDDSEILEVYADQVGLSQSAVLRSYIRSLKSKVNLVSHNTVAPMLLPSLPVSTVSSLIPSVSCVYYFLNEKGDVLYIGSAENLKKALIDHRNATSVLAMGCRVRVHWVEMSKASLKSFEEKSIARFMPSLNEAGK